MSIARAECVIAAGEHPQEKEFDQGHDLRLVRLALGMPSLGVLNWTGLRNYWRLLRQPR